MKKLLFILLFFILCIPISAEENQTLDCLSFKATVIMNGKEIEYEYINPNEFEVEIGNKVSKGEEAVQQVQSMYQLLNLAKGSEVNEIIEKLNENGYSNIEKVDIRWINTDGELYTWIWHK